MKDNIPNLLDSILLYLRDNRTTFNSVHKINEDLNNNESFTGKHLIFLQELPTLLEHLNTEGYIKYSFFSEASEVKITLQGWMFINQGGYRNKIKNEKRSSVLSNIQLWIICIGTGIAGLYALVEFYQWCCSQK